MEFVEYCGMLLNSSKLRSATFDVGMKNIVFDFEDGTTIKADYVEDAYLSLKKQLGISSPKSTTSTEAADVMLKNLSNIISQMADSVSKAK